MPSYGIRGKKNVLVITHYSYSDTEPVGPCHHIFQEILRDRYLVNTSVNVWGHATGSLRIKEVTDITNIVFSNVIQ